MFIRKISIKNIAVSTLLFFSLSAQTAFAYDLSDYKVITPKITEITHIDKNISIIEPIIKDIESKVIKQKKFLKNSTYLANMAQLNSLKENFNRLNFAQKAGNPEKAREFLDKVLVQIKDVQLMIMPSRNVETRGLYLDTDNIPLTKPEITKLIKEIKYANFNIIYPEVFRRGYTIFKNTVADTEKEFKAADFDVLEFLIQEAHKNGIEVYPWLWTFRVKSPLYSDYFLKKYPNMIARREVTRFEDREPLFLSPASPQARNLILKLLRTLTVNYDIDGLLLDYIRYDEMMPYDTITRKYFEEYYFQKYQKKVPDNIVPNSDTFKELQIWREEQVTSMVKTSKAILKNLKPKLKIGVAIFRTEREGRILKMQDWRHWSANDYIDFVCPMLYTDNTKDLEDWLNSETDKNTRFDYLYPSLGAHRFYDSDNIFPLIGLLHKRNIPGLNVFSLAHIGRENLPDLRKGVFKENAVITDKNINASFKLILENFKQNLKDLNIVNAQVNNKTRELETLLTKNDYLNAISKITDIEKSLAFIKDKELQEYLYQDLGYVLRLIKVQNRIIFAKDNFTKVTDPPLIK